MHWDDESALAGHVGTVSGMKGFGKTEFSGARGQFRPQSDAEASQGHQKTLCLKQMATSQVNTCLCPRLLGFLKGTIVFKPSMEHEHLVLMIFHSWVVWSRVPHKKNLLVFPPPRIPALLELLTLK